MGLLSGNGLGAYKSVDRTNFVCTAGQTVFTLTQGYNIGDVDVYINGIKLVEGDDFYAVNGSTITLNSGAGAGDTLAVVSYNQFNVSNTYTKSEADTRYMVATGGNPMTSYLRTPNYGVSSWSDTATASLEASVGSGEQGVGIKTFGRSISTNGGNIHYIADTRGAGGSHKFYGWNGTSLTNFMSIDSSGRMTRPTLPAFQTSNVSFSAFSSAKKPIITSTLYNNGSWYDSGNGRFTAQVSGLFHFHATCTPSSATSSPALYFSKNGTYDQQGITLAYSTSYNGCATAANIYLNAGEYVQCIIEEWNGSSLTIWNSSWGGHLLG
jgi:hypothetical protein